MVLLRKGKLAPVLALSVAVVLLSFFASGTVCATSIEINTLLGNPSFENPIGSGCPTGWTCTGVFGVYIPIAGQFTPGSDGLPGSLIVPSGTQAAIAPINLSGSGNLSQSSTTATWVAGQQYMFTFWVGLPEISPIDGGAVSWPDTVRLYILANGVTDNLSGSGAIAFDIPSPGLGQWQQITATFTPAQDTGQFIGVDFFVSTSHNHQLVDFDIGTPTSPVPEPGGLLLMGSGLLGLAGVLRWKIRR